MANKLPLVSASTDAINYLQTLPFPGNIRELKNLVERAVLMHESPLSASPLGENLKEGDMLTVADFQNKVLTSNEVFPQRGSGEGASLSTLDDLERTAIAACIQKHGGNLSLVAKELGISRGALYRKIEKHGL